MRVIYNRNIIYNSLILEEYRFVCIEGSEVRVKVRRLNITIDSIIEGDRYEYKIGSQILIIEYHDGICIITNK